MSKKRYIQDKGFKSDKEMFEAIRRNRELMKDPEGLDMKKMIDKVMKMSDLNLKARVVCRNMLLSVIELSHDDMGFWKRIKFIRSFKNTLDYLVLWQHIQECDKCKIIFQEYMNQIEAFERVKIEITNVRKTD